jgi:hypothetical protein
MTNMSKEEYQARWAEIWSRRLMQLEQDMQVPPPEDMDRRDEWDELSVAAGILGRHLDEYRQKQTDARPD